MQVLMLILMAVVLVPIPAAAPTDSSYVAGLVAAATATLIVGCIGYATLLRRALEGPDPGRAIERAARGMRMVQWIAVGGLVLAVLGLGLLEAVRDLVGDLPLLDEAVTIAPALVVIVVAWWVFHPFERRLQESVLLRRLDDGRPVGPIPGKAAWVLMQVRLQMLVLLLPVALLTLVSESARLWMQSWRDPPVWLWYGVLIAAVVPIAILAPWLVVRVMGARPMPAGDIRSSLERMCEVVDVRVRDLLLWPTGGTIVNAAVTGLVPRARWILMTDGLLETLPRPQILAVMAHELGHARLRHMPWMAIAVVSMSMGLGIVVDTVASRILAQSPQGIAGADGAVAFGQAVDAVAVATILVSVLLLFGWISRRFERQADAFAAVHVSRQLADACEVVESAGVDAMSSALLGVSTTNGVSPRRFSWRHGSIESRCRHLRSLVGRRVDALPIDREVDVIKAGALSVLAASLGWWIWLAIEEVPTWTS